MQANSGCILLKFYIKPQLVRLIISRRYCCILLKFYIKPQLFCVEFKHNLVVSYWNSTSNHNQLPLLPDWRKLYLIEILHQTTTDRPHVKRVRRLYLIEILHQTTTRQVVFRQRRCCILLKFYIKPQPSEHQTESFNGCILLKFYIKPQRRRVAEIFFLVVSYWNSTSNHNSRSPASSHPEVVSYWNSTSNHNRRHRLILSA